ncbi:MAG TPA: hypothetical protein EYP10_13805, partial [Armatimonadetes bacterium]|nr:hypothetical protein [Armatimonadota bacterium]
MRLVGTAPRISQRMQIDASRRMGAAMLISLLIHAIGAFGVGLWSMVRPNLGAQRRLSIAVDINQLKISRPHIKPSVKPLRKPPPKVKIKSKPMPAPRIAPPKLSLPTRTLKRAQVTTAPIDATQVLFDEEIKPEELLRSLTALPPLREVRESALPHEAVEEALPEGVLAVYVGGKVTVDDFVSYLQSRYGFEPSQLRGRPELIEEALRRLLILMVLCKMAVRKAEQVNLTDPQQLDRVVRELANDMRAVEVLQQLAQQPVKVTEEEIARYYQEHRDEFGNVSLVSVRDYIKRKLHEKKLREQTVARLNELRQMAQVETNYDALKDPNAPPDTPLFIVNGQPFTIADWRKWLATIDPRARKYYSDPERARELLDVLLLRQLLLSTHPEADEQQRRRMEMLKEQILLTAFHYANVESKINVTTDEVKQWYEQLKERFWVPPRVKFSWVRVRITDPFSDDAERTAKEKLNKIRDEIIKTGDFEAVGRRWADADADVQYGTTPNWVVKGSHDLLDPFQPCPFCRVVFNLKVGEISEPFR